MNRTTSEKGIALIKQFEGCRLEAYKPVKTEKYYTIGWGHYGSDVKKNQKITLDQADKMLKSDLKKYEANVNKYMKIYNFNQNQFDALVSFAYNIGSIDTLTDNGKRSIDTIKKKLPLYTKAGGKTLAGLIRRREAELKLFNTPVKEAASPVVSNKKSNEEIAKEVIAGKWGTGNARKSKLTKAGYDYEAIRKLVNQMMKKGK